MSGRRKSCAASVVAPGADPPQRQEAPKDAPELAVLEDGAWSADGGPRPGPAPGAEEERRGPASPGGRSRGFRCRYCPFWSGSLARFEEHVDSSHPSVILNPRYRCTACNFSTTRFHWLTQHNQRQHPGETRFRFRRLKQEQGTVLEQSLPARQEEPGPVQEDREEPGPVQKDREEPGPVQKDQPVQKVQEDPGPVQEDRGEPGPAPDLEERRHLPGQLLQKHQIAAVTVNGTVIIPEAGLLQGRAHVSPLLRRPPNFQAVPKVAVPLHTARYNPSLDRSAALITSFNRFPYPTHAELSWLTAASRHPEEQIRVWFTTQRLKQGITWAPEEVEEARKKMFNGCALPQTPLPPAAAARASLNGSGPAHKRPRPPAPFGPEPKRPALAVAPRSAGDKLLMAPPPPPPAPKDRPAAAPPLSVPLRPRPRSGPAVALPSMVFPESLTTPTIAPPPLAAPPFRSSLLIPLASALASADAALPACPALVAPPLRRPPVIRSLRAPPEAPPTLLAQLSEPRGLEAPPSLSRRAAPPVLSRFPPPEFRSWFQERRALRDDLEQAVLGSAGAGGKTRSRRLNGIHKAPPPQAPPAGPGPPDRSAGALLEGGVALDPWPSPEELRWDWAGPAPRGPAPRGAHAAKRFLKNGVNGGQGSPPGSSDDAGPALVRRCGEEGVATNGSSRKALEAEFGWRMEQWANQKQDGPQQQFTDSGQQTSLELRGGVQQALGSWLEEGPPAEDASRRLTG